MLPKNRLVFLPAGRFCLARKRLRPGITARWRESLVSRQFPPFFRSPWTTPFLEITSRRHYSAADSPPPSPAASPVAAPRGSPAAPGPSLALTTRSAPGNTALDSCGTLHVTLPRPFLHG